MSNEAKQILEVINLLLRKHAVGRRDLEHLAELIETGEYLHGPKRRAGRMTTRIEEF